MKVTTGEQRCNCIRFRQCSDVGWIDLLQVIAACRAKFHRQLRCTSARQLFAVHLRDKTVTLPGFKNTLRLLSGERTAIAKNIAEFRELLAGYFWHELFD